MYLSKKGKKLYKYYQQYETDFFLYLAKTTHETDESDIHGLRVTVKKLKGVFKLIDLLSEDFVTKKHFAALKKLFKPAGNIRECQVNIRRLKSFKNHESFFNLYKKSKKNCIKKYRKDFNNALLAFNPYDIKKAGKQIKECCKKLSKQSIYSKSHQFIEQRLKLIEGYYSNVSQDIEMVHEIRIQLKEISAILGLLHHIRPEIVKPETLADLKTLESGIGLWHDYTELQKSITLFCKNNATDCINLKEDIAVLKSEISAEEKKFISQLEVFLFKAKALIHSNLTSLSDKFEKPFQTSSL